MPREMAPYSTVKGCGEMKRKIGLVMIVLAIAVSVAVTAYGRPDGKKVHAAGCMSTQVVLPDFIKGRVYDASGLPQSIDYGKRIPGDKAHAGTYVRAYRAANINLKTMKLAPTEGSKGKDPLIYVDRAADCTGIYVVSSHSRYDTAVYVKKTR